MSLISIYTDILKEHGADFDIIYMDKYGEEEEISAKNKYVFVNIIDSSKPRIIKAFQYLKFRRFAIPLLEKNKYDFIIVWNDVAIIMFADYLSKKWKNKYCLNIRDYGQQKVKWIYNRFSKVIKNSSFTTISSEGFRSFLPEHEYVQIHSLNLSVLKNADIRTSLREKNKPIRIAFIGNIRFFEMNQKLLELFKNDDRFQLCFFGTNANQLETYAKENAIRNVQFHDTFPVKDTHLFLQETDLINNLYGNNSIALKYALSIKLYHGLYLRMPILVNNDTWGEQIVNKYGTGFVMHEMNTDFKEKLYSWYTSLDFSTFNNGCENYLRKAKHDNQVFESIMIKMIE